MTVSSQLHSPHLARTALTDAVPQVAGAIILIFLVIAIGFMFAAYAEAAARRIRPRIVLTQHRPDHDQLSSVVLPFVLLAALVAVAMFMDRV
ncbi:MAG: hypothetical protein JNL54_07100 [Kineosporiaceae bacterium]|nr:hypothetical protein [Kineosporiaceae bacterium]